MVFDPSIKMAGERVLEVSPDAVWDRLMIVLHAVGSSVRLGEVFEFVDPTLPPSEDQPVRLELTAIEPRRRLGVRTVDGTELAGEVLLELTGIGTRTQIQLSADWTLPGGWLMGLFMKLYRSSINQGREGLLYYLLFEVEALAAGVASGRRPDPRSGLPLGGLGGSTDVQGKDDESTLLRIYDHAVAAGR